MKQFMYVIHHAVAWLLGMDIQSGNHDNENIV